MTRRRSAPEQRLGDILPGIVRLAQQRQKALATIQARWPRLVGPELAAHTKPVSLRRGRLVVHVAQPGDAFALSYERARVLARLQRVRDLKVEEVIIRAGDV